MNNFFFHLEQNGKYIEFHLCLHHLNESPCNRLDYIHSPRNTMNVVHYIKYLQLQFNHCSGAIQTKTLAIYHKIEIGSISCTRQTFRWEKIILQEECENGVKWWKIVFNLHLTNRSISVALMKWLIISMYCCQAYLEQEKLHFDKLSPICFVEANV